MYVASFAGLFNTCPVFTFIAGLHLALCFTLISKQQKQIDKQTKNKEINKHNQKQKIKTRQDKTNTHTHPTHTPTPPPTHTHTLPLPNGLNKVGAVRRITIAWFFFLLYNIFVNYIAAEVKRLWWYTRGESVTHLNFESSGLAKMTDNYKYNYYCQYLFKYIYHYNSLRRMPSLAA